MSWYAVIWHNCVTTLWESIGLSWRIYRVIGKAGQHWLEITQLLATVIPGYFDDQSSDGCKGPLLPMDVSPPSANRHVPVTYDASSEARNKTHAAISAGVAGRLSMVA